jgi:hypothetical protein
MILFIKSQLNESKNTNESHQRDSDEFHLSSKMKGDSLVFYSKYNTLVTIGDFFWCYLFILSRYLQ